MDRAPVVDPSVDALALLHELVREGRRMPGLMVPAEFATVGPVLNLLVGGREGVDRYRRAVIVDDLRYIPLYQATLAALLRPVPMGSRLVGLVDRAVQHDRAENASLLAAFDLLDPQDGSAPRVLAASRFTGPAAIHAGVKFALLLPAVAPATLVAAVLAARRAQRDQRSG